MDQYVKLPSQQSLFNATNNLVDLIVPANSGVYDLSSTYISVLLRTDNIELDGTTAAPGGKMPAAGGIPDADAVADIRLNFAHNAAGDTIYANTAMPIETLVRDCSLFSSTRGKVEDIRRSDTLRATRKAYLSDMSDVQGASLVGSAGMAKTNPWASGGFAQLVGVGTVASKYRSHELRIYLRDIFNFAQAEEVDTSDSAYGALHIHCELNIDRLVMRQNLGDFDGVGGVWALDYHDRTTGLVDSAYNNVIQTKILTSPAAATTTDTMTMSAPYDSLESAPFWVNQMIKVETTIGVAGGITPVTGQPPFFPATATVVRGVIKEILWDSVTKQVSLKFGGAILTTPAIEGTLTTPTDTPVIVSQSIEGIDVTAASLLPANLTYQGIELTAVRAPVMSGPQQIQYTQYQTQQDQFSSGATLTRSYFLPAQTTNAIIVLPAPGSLDGSDILGSARLTDYRFSLDGVAVTNRPVAYMPQADITANKDAKCEAGSSMHYDLIAKTFMNQGQRFHSLQEAVYDQIVPMSTPVPRTAGGAIGWPSLGESPKKRCYMLALPVPISNDQTQLTIELNGKFTANNGRIHIYSEVRSVV